jgi:xanthine dehydrogenase accessory factor
MPTDLSDLGIIIRGAGEMATGTAWRLFRAGFRRILMTERVQPLSVRRLVCFSEAVHEGSWTVEGVRAERIVEAHEAPTAWAAGCIPVIVDPENRSKHSVRTDVLVDAILAKKNTGTCLGDAALVIGLGPGFHAGRDVHLVVETNRGHSLGRVIQVGAAQPDTGIPGNIGGETTRRVIRASADGTFESDLAIAERVTEGQVVAGVSGEPVIAALSGVLRGLIRPGTRVVEGLKIGDIDPRENPVLCRTISEKALAIAGGVLEAILMRYNNAAHFAASSRRRP